MNINKKLMNINHTSLKRSKNAIKWIVIHYVGALGDAKDNATYYGSTYVGASADFFVGFKGDIWQANDYYNYYSWHCGGGLQGSGGAKYYQQCTNSNSIGIEMCVKKKSTATMNATDRDWYFEDATINATVELVRHLMSELSIDINHVIRHYDVTSKICPNPFVYNTGKVTWEQFKAKIAGTANSTPTQDTTSFYRVRKSWVDSASQLGAYTSLDNAKKNCPSDYHVFDESGKIVYSPTVNTSKGTQASDFANLSEKEAAAKILEMCKVDYEKTGVLASVSAAQMILESGYVKTTLATSANNCFGMKTTLSGNSWANSSWDGKSKVTIRTAEEYTVGNVTYINADFRKYPCIEDSIADHSAYLLGAMNGSKKRYEGLTKCKNYKEAITLIKNGGYATDSAYVSKICNIIERFGLNKYDKVVETPVETSKTPYRVGTAWENGKCQNQTGAYDVLDNAKAAADTQAKSKKSTYQVFDNSGKAVYTAKYTSTTSAFIPYDVKVKVPNLRIRKTPNGTVVTNNGKEVFTGIGVFGIVEEKKAGNYTWGLLKAYQKNRNGWIALSDDFVEKV